VLCRAKANKEITIDSVKVKYENRRVATIEAVTFIFSVKRKLNMVMRLNTGDYLPTKRMMD
jgi:hypothetical protein